MEEWPTLDENEKPFGLGVGEFISWNGMRVKRRDLLGPNWGYVVEKDGEHYLVGVFNPDKETFRMRIQGKWLGVEPSILMSEDITASSPEDALIQALAKLQHLLSLPRS